MAITLDELLHKNSGPAESESFPSYEAYSANRADMRSDARQQEMRGEGRDTMTYPEQDRAYEPSRRPYYPDRRPSDVLPKEEPEARDGYGMAPYRTPEDRYADMYDERYHARPNPQPRESVYDFAANDPENKTATELMDRLEYTANNPSYTPVFDEQRYSEQARARRANEEKSAKRLNTRGKIIIALYVAVVAIVVTLIGVNAAKINKGNAVAPTSSFAIEASVER